MAKKTSVIHVRVDDEMKNLLELEAEKEGRSVSNLLYRILTDWTRKRKESAGTD